MLCMPGNGHRPVLDEAAPFVRHGQPVIISSHLSFGALHLSRLLACRGIEAPVIAWSTTLLTAKKPEPQKVWIGTVREAVEIATSPQNGAVAGLAICQQLFGDRFVVRDSLLAIALGNLNPQSHLATAMFNLTRMEQGETWNQVAQVIPVVARLIEALDRERLAIAEAFGVSVRTMRQHLAASYHVA